MNIQDLFPLGWTCWISLQSKGLSTPLSSTPQFKSISSLALSFLSFFLQIFFYYFFLLYNIVLVLPYVNMNLPQVYTCSPSWTPLPSPSPLSYTHTHTLTYTHTHTHTHTSTHKNTNTYTHIYTMEYHLAIKKNTFESVLMKWMKLEPIIQSEVSQKEKHQYSILTHIYGI